MNGRLFAGAAFAVFACGLPAEASVRVAGQSVDKDSICPGASTNKCVINNVGTTTTYIGGSLKYISLDANKKPELDDYLGHVFAANMANGQPYCENSSTNVIKDYANKKDIPYLRENPAYSNHFHIKSKAKKVIGTSLGLDAKAVAQAAGVPPESLNQVAAAISAGYNKASNKDVELWGWFRYYEINPQILTEFNSANAPAELKACRDWLVANKKKLTWTLTGYQLDDAKVTTDFSSAFSAALEAAVKGKADATQIAAITAAYSSAVERKAEVNISPTFGLLTVGRAP